MKRSCSAGSCLLMHDRMRVRPSPVISTKSSKPPSAILHREREHRRAVRRVVDRHERTAQHFGAAAFEQAAEHLELAHLGDGDALAFEVPVDLGRRGHGWSTQYRHDLDACARDADRAPGRAPAMLDAREPDEREHRQRGEHQEARLVVAGELLRQVRGSRPGRIRRRRRSCRRGRSSRRSRGGSAAARAGTPSRCPCRTRACRRRTAPSAAYTLCGWKLTAISATAASSVHDAQRLDAADAIGERAADRPHQRADEHAGRGEVAGGHRIETVVGVEVDRERGGEADESAERHGVEEHEPPRVAHAQHGEVLVEVSSAAASSGLSFAANR